MLRDFSQNHFCTIDKVSFERSCNNALLKNRNTLLDVEQQETHEKRILRTPVIISAQSLNNLDIVSKFRF